MDLLRIAVLVVAGSLTAACTDASDPANTVAFDLESQLDGTAFWDLPFPSDLRLTADGRPDLAGFPNRRNLGIVNDLLSGASERAGFPTMPTAWFRFTGEPPAHALDTLLDDTEALLVDIDLASGERGTTYPILARTLADDDYTGRGVVALTVRPGIVLRGHTTYAFVLRRAFAPGVEPPSAFTALAAGRTPSGARGPAARELYAPLWSTLDDLGVPRNDLLAATVLTTGDETALLRRRSEAVRAAARATIDDLHVVALHPGYCELAATVTVPQYQLGTPPFDHDGRFALDAAGVPIVQRQLAIPLRLVLPTQTMPAAGWPLWQFFHGSGGASVDIVDDGPSATADDLPAPGEGPGAVVARRGIAAVATALPLNPERQPGASNYAYLNLNNLSAFPYTFQQGVFEQRLLLDALLAVQLPAAIVAGCPGLALPSGATAHHFDPAKLTAGGHSMGGMYTNMIAAVEPRYGALTPFGAGGFWSMMILETAIVPGSRNLLGSVLGVDGDQLDFTHPAMSLITLGWEIAEPGVAMAHISQRPLDGVPARHVYQPVGLDDQFFPNPVFDAAALAYGNQQAGDLVWPGTQDALRAGGLAGVIPYPVRANRGAMTSVVVQYHDDGLLDAHYIHRQLEAVRYQYSCFLTSYLRDGVPTVPAPAPITSACP